MYEILKTYKNSESEIKATLERIKESTKEEQRNDPNNWGYFGNRSSKPNKDYRPCALGW